MIQAWLLYIAVTVGTTMSRRISPYFFVSCPVMNIYFSGLGLYKRLWFLSLAGIYFPVLIVTLLMLVFLHSYANRPSPLSPLRLCREYLYTAHDETTQKPLSSFPVVDETSQTANFETIFTNPSLKARFSPILDSLSKGIGSTNSSSSRLARLGHTKLCLLVASEFPRSMAACSTASPYQR